jgi:hypothetical protein
MLEIYNEVITDLLNPSGSNLQIREDIKRGCYVEDLSESLIQNGNPGSGCSTHSNRSFLAYASLDTCA